MKLNWDIFKLKFGTWAPKIKPFFDSGGIEKIYEELKRQGEQGVRIVPDSPDTFRCFRETPINQLVAVICGLCPYHTVIDNVCVADGLMTSCSKTGKLQPSLEHLYEAFEEEFYDGLCLPCNRNPDLSYLARQGILLFNAALTTIEGKAKQHQGIWAPFTRYIFDEIISLTGVPVVFLGEEARDFSSFLAPEQPSFELSHPASVCYGAKKGQKWSSKGVFTKVNSIVYENNGVELLWMLETVPF